MVREFYNAENFPISNLIDFMKDLLTLGFMLKDVIYDEGKTTHLWSDEENELYITTAPVKISILTDKGAEPVVRDHEGRRRHYRPR